jgi:hypothetical protein
MLPTAVGYFPLPKEMRPDDNTSLRDEFIANLDLWKHEEGLRQQRNTVLLGANAFLAVAVSAMISVGPPRGVAVGIGLVLALFGLAICWVWHSLQHRHVVYADFRRKQLRELAANLGYESWENQWIGLRTRPAPSTVSFTITGANFDPPANSRSAIEVESYLPMIVAGLWALFAIGCLGFAILG